MAVETREQRAIRLATLGLLRRFYLTAVAVTILGVAAFVFTVVLAADIDRFVSDHSEWGWLMRLVIDVVPSMVMGLGIPVVAILWFTTHRLAIPGVPEQLPMKWRWRTWSLVVVLAVGFIVLMVLVVAHHR